MSRASCLCFGFELGLYLTQFIFRGLLCSLIEFTSFHSFSYFHFIPLFMLITLVNFIEEIHICRSQNLEDFNFSISILFDFILFDFYIV